jgi:hypothetical protein
MEGKEMSVKQGELLNKAKLMMELRGYQKESLHQGDEVIDIKAAKPDSDETVLMRIVTKSKLKSDGVGVEKVKETEQILEKPDIDEIIVFGKNFSVAARRNLREDGIEFFSGKQRIVSTLNQQDLYASIFRCVDEFCQIKCGHVPQSEAECKGYSAKAVTCSFCGESGQLRKTPSSGRQQRCPVCGGAGSRENQYSCEVRLISDNADFHVEHGWKNLLQKDLSALLKILRSLKRESNKDLPISLSHESSVKATVSVTGR